MTICHSIFKYTRKLDLFIFGAIFTHIKAMFATHCSGTRKINVARHSAKIVWAKSTNFPFFLHSDRLVR